MYYFFLTLLQWFGKIDLVSGGSMYKAYKFRMYPNQKQITLIHQNFGCVRFVYNHFLELCKNNGYQSAFEMCKCLKEMYKEYPWLKECDSCSLRCAIFNLEDAYKNFFAKRSNYPVFKNKYTNQSYRTNCIRSSYKGKEYRNIEINLNKKIMKLPKLGKVEIRGYRNLEKLEGRIINATITKEVTGKYYVSIIVEEKERLREKVIPNNIVGLDLGVKDLVITSNGEKFSNPKELRKYEDKIKRLQRKLSRQIKGSKNYQKTKLKLAKIYSKIKNSRKHYIMDIVNKIVEENDIIVTEKLNVQKMSQNHRLAKSILDASFDKIITLLKWKVKEKGKYFYQVDTYYASSQICNVCGKKNEKVKNLNIREWECSNCGCKHDRDINASINIMYEGLKMHYGLS